MNKNLPQTLLEKQELIRQQTINRVLRAVGDIKAEGGTVTITALVVFTGLSRSVFAKPHIRELLVEYGYGNSESSPIKQQSKSKKQLNALNEKTNQITQLQAQNAALTNECELLRGRLLLLLQR